MFILAFLWSHSCYNQIAEWKVTWLTLIFYQHEQTCLHTSDAEKTSSGDELVQGGKLRFSFSELFWLGYCKTNSLFQKIIHSLVSRVFPVLPFNNLSLHLTQREKKSATNKIDTKMNKTNKKQNILSLRFSFSDVTLSQHICSAFC